MTAGYSSKSLSAKLGIKAGMRTAFVNAPEGYQILLGQPATIVAPLEHPLDFIQFFTMERLELETRFPTLMKALDRGGMLWISWPKRASKIETDLNDIVVRDIGLSHGLVDVKVCAIDDVWSGLKFIYRTKDR